MTEDTTVERALSHLSFDKIDTRLKTIHSTRENATALPAGLSQASRLIFPQFALLKDALGENGKDFKIVLERHRPPAGSIILGDDDCHNTWHIVGLQGTKVRENAIAALRELTGVEPTRTDDGQCYYDADQLPIMLEKLDQTKNTQRDIF